MLLCVRLERVKFKELRCQAKVIGTLVTFAGALLMTLYKGPEINLFNHPNTVHQKDQSQSHQGHKNWVTGTLFLCLGCLAWSSFYILQVTNYLYMHYMIYIKLYPSNVQQNVICSLTY